MSRILIIGGSDAGISAAFRAREIDPFCETIVVVADEYPHFSICGLPFYLSGEVRDWRALAHRTADDIESEGVQLLLSHRAEAIDPDRKLARVVGKDGMREMHYDKLVIGTGAESIKPGIPGVDLQGVFLLRWMDDCFAMNRYLEEARPRSALIVGGGYIGMEMADALTLRGIEVTVVEFADTVLTTVDDVLGRHVAAELQRHGVKVFTETGIESIDSADSGLRVLGSNGFDARAEMVLVSVGARPCVGIAVRAGVATGFKGAIQTNQRMETNLPNIYAAGDCVVTRHRLLDQDLYLPLGTTAHKQGRVAGENAAGGDREFAGSLGTQAVKIFDLVVARTGLRDSEAVRAGFDPFTCDFESWDHKVYYPGAQKMHLRITGDRPSGRLLGAQILGRKGSEVSKRVDIAATALFHGMRVEDLADLDLSYTPPLSSPWDPVQMAAQAWVRSLK
jgi:NADPH-dependent 2,4-dienoyl-CoA reductase/sulfur reductase-like enzyme